MLKFSKDETLYRSATMLLLLLGGLAAAYLIAEYALPILLPFLLAYLLSLAIRPLVGKLSGGRPVARSIITAVLVILFVGLLILGVIKGCERAISELGKLMEGLSQETSDISRFFSELSGWITSLSRHLPFLKRFEDHPAFDEFCVYLDSTVQSWARSALEALGQKLPAILLGLLSRFPSVLIFSTALLLSCYYFSAHPCSPGERLKKILPQTWQTSCERWQIKLKKALTGYFKAYLLLGLITFGEMFAAFSILKVPYAFLLAWVIALVDFLPLLGAGTVLVPWAIVSLLMGNGGLATGLLVIFGLHTLFRQILEPRLLSRELGLSPLASLAAVYAGWRLFGVTGMIIAPLVALVIKEGLTKPEPHNERN